MPFFYLEFNNLTQQTCYQLHNSSYSVSVSGRSRGSCEVCSEERASRFPSPTTPRCHGGQGEYGCLLPSERNSGYRHTTPIRYTTSSPICPRRECVSPEERCRSPEETRSGTGISPSSDTPHRKHGDSPPATTRDHSLNQPCTVSRHPSATASIAEISQVRETKQLPAAIPPTNSTVSPSGNRNNPPDTDVSRGAVCLAGDWCNKAQKHISKNAMLVDCKNIL